MEIKNCDRLGEGKGLFATKFYGKGTIVHTLNGIYLNAPTKYSIYVGDGLHIEDPFGIYINHSSNPTTYVCGKNIIAKLDLQIGDEITFDYNENEINMAAPFYDDKGNYICGKILIKN